MNYSDLELETTTKCVVCNDTLAVWEERICLICEVDGE